MRRGHYEDQRTDDPFCNDPTHPDDCDCGADPDYEYERRVEDEKLETDE